MRHQSFLLTALLLLAATAHAAPSAVNSDAGHFNPVGAGASAQPVLVAAPAALTHYPPVILLVDRPRKPYALVAAPTLPCAPAYCPRRVRVDRH